MINYYSAFISYKHADLDNKVAAAIVRGLEHYHIPGKIRKQTGVKKIDRIFRDKDELPITNDLNDTIAEALKNADYLIVICSTNTRKSTWVEKEIETFLKNHTMGQVLTVLADGEPYDVIPKILLTSKKEVTDENGEKHIIEVPLEPLSCDFRIPFKKAMAEELPRLAAALIGCSYDELMNRHRQYKMRRLTAIFAGAMAIMLGFAGYMLYSNTLIHKNYIESLRSKSKYLANESLKQLDNENRIEAMQLALEALPKDENDEMPVTPEAQKAITKASLAYEAQRGSNLCSAWNYEMSNEVRAFKVSNDGSKLAAEDSSDNVTVWDTKSHQVILNKVIEKFNDFFFFDNDTLLITSWNALEAYDLKTGDCLWRNEDYRVNQDLFVYTDNSFLVPTSLGGVCELSIKDCSEIKKYDLQILEDVISLDSADNYALSDDKKRLAFTVGVGKNEDYSYENKEFTLYEYDLKTGDLSEYFIGENRPGSVAYLDGNIYVACSRVGLDGSQKLYNYIYITEDHSDILCLSSGDLSLKWQYDFVSSNVSYKRGFKKLTGNDMAYFSGNKCCVWDNETGELLLEHNLNDSIMTVHDSGRELDPTYVTRSGDTASAVAMSDRSYGISFNRQFTSDLTDVVIKKGAYTHKDISHTIVYYGTDVSDDQWTKFDNCPVFKSAATYSLFGDVFVVAKASTDGEGTDLMLFDASDKSYKTTVHISDDESYTQFNGLGTYDGKLYYIYSDRDDESFDYHLILESYNLLTGEIISEELNNDYGSSYIYATMNNDELIYFNNHGYDSAVVAKRNLSTGAEKEIPIEDLEVYSAKFLKYFPDTDIAFLICGMYDSPEHKLIDFKTGSVIDITLPPEWGTVSDVAIDENGKLIALTNGEIILLKSMEGDLISEISCNNAEPMGMLFHNFKDYGNLLIVPYRNGTMYRYNGETGEFVGKSDLSTYANNYDYKATFEVDDANNLLYVHEDNIMNVFELDSWIETSFIKGCYGHHTATDTFITNSYKISKECTLGYFNHYSTQDLINKTRDYLQGSEMGEEQKSMYGIN